MALLKNMLSQLGIEGGRVRLEWVSASEGDRFAAIVNEMTDEIRRLGPFKPLKYPVEQTEAKPILVESAA